MRKSPPCSRATLRGTGELVYLCALRASGADELTGWLAISAGEQAITDERHRAPRRVDRRALRDGGGGGRRSRDADALVAAVQTARRWQPAMPACSEALAACEPPATALAEGAAGVRVATDAYVDCDRPRAPGGSTRRCSRCGRSPRGCRPRSRASPAIPASRSRAPSGRCSGGITQAGGPARLADPVGAATGAIAAFAEDVLERYRVRSTTRGGAA